MSSSLKKSLTRFLHWGPFVAIGKIISWFFFISFPMNSQISACDNQCDVCVYNVYCLYAFEWGYVLTNKLRKSTNLSLVSRCYLFRHNSECSIFMCSRIWNLSVWCCCHFFSLNCAKIWVFTRRKLQMLLLAKVTH